MFFFKLHRCCLKINELRVVYSKALYLKVEDSKRGNTAAMRERLKTVSQRRGIDETKSF